MRSSRSPSLTVNSTGSTITCFLVGFMGAGKSTVGRIVSESVGWAFSDLDDCIETTHQRSIAELFNERGEESFREIERSALRALVAESHVGPRIVALGGGAFVSPSNHELTRSGSSISIFLDAPAEELYRRCNAQNSQRPLHRSFDDFRNLYQARRTSYQAATLTVDTLGKDVDQIAGEIAAHLARFREITSQ